MTTIDEKQVSKLLDDIASIKTIISENKPLMKQLLLPVHFRAVSFFAGVVIIGISALYYFLLDRYGVYDSIPENLRWMALGVVFVCWLVTLVMKRVNWIRSVRKIDHQITFRQAVKSLYRAQIFHVWIPIIVMIVFASGYLVMMGSPRYIVPLAATGIGIIYNMIGGITRIPQYLVTGYWLFLTSLLPFLFPMVSALIFLAISLGGSMLIFGILVGMNDE